jgi:hypothetical protein
MSNSYTTLRAEGTCEFGKVCRIEPPRAVRPMPIERVGRLTPTSIPKQGEEVHRSSVRSVSKGKKILGVKSLVN